MPAAHPPATCERFLAHDPAVRRAHAPPFVRRVTDPLSAGQPTTTPYLQAHTVPVSLEFRCPLSPGTSTPVLVRRLVRDLPARHELRRHPGPFAHGHPTPTAAERRQPGPRCARRLAPSTGVLLAHGPAWLLMV